MPVLWVIYHYQLFALLPPLDASNEAKSSVLVSLRDTVDGLQHIRSFRWESRNFQRQLDVVERSQRLVYEVYTVERKQLATYEALTAFIGSMVVYVIVRYTESVSEAAAGLSVVALLTLSCNMALIIPQVIGIEKSMGVVARMRKLISHAPQEPRDGNMRLPPRWPRRGEILFRNVTVKYRYLILRNICIQASGY
jgi:ABC-type multidrug transport system fused ATPase/permease subunit